MTKNSTPSAHSGSILDSPGTGDSLPNLKKPADEVGVGPGTVEGHQPKRGKHLPMIAGCTIVSKNYLSLARVWNDSFKRQHPGARTFVLIVDRIEGAFDPSKEDFETIEVESLGIPEFLDLAFQYNILELNTAVKPFFLEFLLRERDVDHVAYFDPDVMLYAPIDRVREALVDQSIVLLPHILTPMPSDGKRPNEIDFLVSGTYNLGFIAVRQSPDTLDFLLWWQSRLLEHGLAAPDHGLFTDQKWIDLVPALFGGVVILKDRGYNVAYWNLHERSDLIEREGRFLFPETPLVFFHFSGLNIGQPEQVSKHQNRYRLGDLNAAFQRVFAEYGTALREANFEITRQWRYAFNHFEDGSLIDPLWRRLHREARKSRERWSNPFRTGPGSFQEWLIEPGRPGSQIPRFLDAIYGMRPDLQAGYPNPSGSDARSFLGWAVTSVSREYGIGDPFLSSLQLLIDTIDRERWESRKEPERPPAPERIQPSPSRQIATKLSGADRLRALDRIRTALRTRHGWMLEESRSAGRPRSARGRWARSLLGASLFDRVRGLLWIVRSMAEHSRDAEAASTKLSRLLSQVLGAERYRSARRILCQLREWGREQADENVIAPGRRGSGPILSVDRELPFGVNLIGYFDTESGVGEIARSLARMLKYAEIPSVLRNVEQPWLRRRDHTFSRFSPTSPYAINLLVVNADQVPNVVSQLGKASFDGRHNVGYWFWELSSFPDRFDDAFNYFNEIWVASLFCQKAIAGRSPIPVLRIPPGFAFHDSSQNGRTRFGFDPDEFVFVYVFDGASSLKRKNPGAVISAFRRAFPSAGNERLILKTANASISTQTALRRLAGRSRVEVLGEYMDREELLELIAAADCYVSLHRSEGFGLTILEAMAMGKPVIATNYSGNTDFLHRNIGYPVRFRMVELAGNYGPYSRGNVWAEPDLEEAARCMSLVRSQPDLSDRLGNRARQEIRSSWSVPLRADQLRERLNQVRNDRSIRIAPDWVA